MDAHCPRDEHLRILNRNTGRLSCQHRECSCTECHRILSPHEQQDWHGRDP